MDQPSGCPQVLSVGGAPIGSAVEILAAGPCGSVLSLQLRWPDGTEFEAELLRPEESNVPPPKKHFGKRWVVSGRVGSVGYIRIKTFDPAKGTLGPAGKMTPILREHLEGLLDTDAMILDFQSNGGGLVAASDPFLSHFLNTRLSYAWGNSGGRSRVLVPRSPRYRRPLVALIDERSASGGEWAPRILRDAKRATVIGGRSLGAEAAVHTSTASDGSQIQFSAWPMVEPGLAPFQDRGVELDHSIPLTIEEVREHGYEVAKERVLRRRLAKAIEVLEAPAEDLDSWVELVHQANRENTDDFAP